MKTVFVVVTVTREDVRWVLHDKTLELSDEEMQAIATRMVDTYNAHALYYWDVVTEAAETVLREGGEK